MSKINTVKCLKAAREQCQNCWPFMFLSPLAPNHKTALEHNRKNTGQAAEAELQKTLQNISDTQKDRVGRLPKWLGRNLFKGCMLVRSLSAYKKLYETIMPCSYLGTNLAEDKNPCPTVGQQLSAAIPQHLVF